MMWQLLLLALCGSAAADDFIHHAEVVFTNKAKTPMGLFVAQSPNDEPVAYERFLKAIPAGESATERVYYDTRVTVRSADFKFRAAIALGNNDGADAKVRPGRFTFYNLGMEDDHGPVELKHSTSGYVWLESGAKSVQDTDVNHEFTLSNKDQAPMVTVRYTKAKRVDL